MTNKPDVITPVRPGRRRQMPSLAADPNAWIEGGQTPAAETQTPTATAPSAPPPAPVPPTPTAPSPEASTPQPTPEKPEPHHPDKKMKVFTLDIPIALHKAMRRKTILAGTNMTADAQRVLNDAYHETPPQDIPDYPRLEPSETQRITISLTHDLHTRIKLNTLDSGSTMANEIRYHLEREYGGE